MPNPPLENNMSGANEDIPGEKGPYRNLVWKRKLKARKKRRRFRPSRRAARRKVICDRERARKREITVATYDVRTMTIDAEVLGEYRQAGLDIIGLQETRRDGQSQLRQAGYVVYCSGTYGDKGGRKKGQGGVGLAIRETITRAVVRPPEFINE